ncbi:uncharacterized protein METZ01_LOCUS119006, partial [marine metagenome]
VESILTYQLYNRRAMSARGLAGLAS